MSDEDTVQVFYYDHDCEWISKYCDEHHRRSALVPRAALGGAYTPVTAIREAKAEAWDEGYHYITFGGKSLDANPYREGADHAE